MRRPDLHTASHHRAVHRIAETGLHQVCRLREGFRQHPQGKSLAHTLWYGVQQEIVLLIKSFYNNFPCKVEVASKVSKWRLEWGKAVWCWLSCSTSPLTAQLNSWAFHGIHHNSRVFMGPEAWHIKRIFMPFYNVFHGFFMVTCHKKPLNFGHKNSTRNRETFENPMNLPWIKAPDFHGFSFCS